MKSSRLIYFTSRRRSFDRRTYSNDSLASSALFSSRSMFSKIGHVLQNVFRYVVQLGFKRAVIRLVILGAVVVGSYVGFLWITLPDLSDPSSLLASQSTVITDREGVELYRLFSEEDRTYIDGSQIPESMKQAMLAIEDERFFDRGCIDVRAILRAIFANILSFKSQGGSTITQQLARNALLTREKRISRKVKELMLACQLESDLTKDELLELYLNWIPFGQNAYGVEQASQVYFGKSASGLTLAESSVLAALPQRPTYFSPYGSHVYTEVGSAVENGVLEGKITKSSQVDSQDVIIGLIGSVVGTGSTTLYVGGRTDQVLKNMEDQGFISEAERLEAIAELEVMEFTPARENIRAPHFVLRVREEVEEMFAGTLEEGILERGGLTIETTLDWDIQEAAEGVVAFHKEDIQTRFGAENMALLSMDPHTREVLAYVGNMDYSDTENGGKIDMVEAPRQPGSSFKPFVYIAAFQNGYSPATVLWDVPTKVGDNQPQNFDGEFMGPMTIRQALGASRNVPAAKAYFLGGEEDSILELVSVLGAPTPKVRKAELQKERAGGFDYGWPLSLGAAETPLSEMVQAYSTLASGGKAMDPVRIRRITDKNGNILYEHKPDTTASPVIDPRTAYQITSVLSDETVRPDEYWRSQLTVPGYQTAAKTGTSNKCLEWKDANTCKLRKPDNAWLIGYTPNLVTGVWVGNANSAAMYDTAGGLNTASPIWRDFMMKAHRNLESTKPNFVVPEGIVQPQISTLSGELPTDCTPVELRRADVFLEENPPSKQDPACAELTVDKLTRLLASEECPAEAQEEGSFFVAHSILPQRWPTWEEGVRTWVDEQMELWYADESHSGAIIPMPVAPVEYCDPSLTPGRLEKPELTVIYPRPNAVVSYPSFRPKIDVSVGSSIRSVRYVIDDKEVAEHTDEPFDRAIRVLRSIKKGGSHTLEVILEDEYFNQVKEVIPIRFGEDRGKPNVRFLSPREDIQIDSGEELQIHASAEDPDGGIKYVQFYLDDTLLTTKPKEPFEMEYTFDLPDGVYTLKARAEDFAKNVSEDRIRVTIGDAAAPSPTSQSDDIGEPELLLPDEGMSYSVGESVDIHVETPELGASYHHRLVLRVIREDVDYEDVLLDIREGDGVYKRQWIAGPPGTYTVQVLTEDQRRNERVIVERQLAIGN